MTTSTGISHGDLTSNKDTIALRTVKKSNFSSGPPTTNLADAMEIDSLGQGWGYDQTEVHPDRSSRTTKTTTATGKNSIASATSINTTRKATGTPPTLDPPTSIQGKEPNDRHNKNRHSRSPQTSRYNHRYDTTYSERQHDKTNDSNKNNTSTKKTEKIVRYL